MRHKFIIILSIILLTSSWVKANVFAVAPKTVICGTLSNEENVEHTITAIISTPENLSSTGLRYSLTIKNGKFHFPLEVSTARSLGIQIDGELVLFKELGLGMFIEPGDSLHFEFKAFKKPRFEILNCTGRGSSKINFLMEALVQGKKFKKDNWNDFLADSTIWRTRYDLKAANNKAEILDRYKSNFSPEMADILKSDIANTSFSLLIEFMVKRWKPGNKELESLEKEMTGSQWMPSIERAVSSAANGGYLFIYLQMAAVFDYQVARGKRMDTNFWLLKEPYLYYKILDNYYKKSSVRNWLLATFINRAIKRLGLTEQMKQCANNFLANKDSSTIYNAQIRRILTEEQLKMGKLLPPDFTLSSITSDSVSLKAYAGKVVVIDFWFTGCTYCSKVKPYFEQAEKYFKKETNVVFLSVSIDRHKPIWIKKGIGKFSSATAVQLYTGGQGEEHPIIKYLNFSGYPSIFIISPQGYITRVDASSIMSDTGVKKFRDSIEKNLSLTMK